jgi:long-chain acyl-CoA synthetase
MIFCGGAFTDRALAEFFSDLGIPVVIGYGLTEACTVATVNDLKPFRGDTVGRAVPGVDVRIVNAGPDGVGEVQIAGPTVFAGYLDDPEQTGDAFDGAWLRTGDLGWLDAAHHLHLVGRSKNMIVTPGGKNVYPEDVESAFDRVDVDELCVLAEDYVWPRTGLVGERLVAVVRVHDERRDAARKALAQRNRALPEHKRLGGVLWLDDTFPRTASMKLKRADLASRVRDAHPRDAVEDLA